MAAGAIWKVLGFRPGRSGSETERWLGALPETPEFQVRCRDLGGRPELRSITGADEMATISLLVERLRPGVCLEIGTFFAGTSRVIAEALLAAGGTGRLLTIDPYGGHRVPEILDRWPEDLRRLVEFRPVNSMTLFDDLENNRFPKGGKSPLGLVFVDGNHNFEYALFDIIRAADFLTPGGAIVIDNMDQEGPRQAAIRFLEWNPAWRLSAGGRMYDGRQPPADLTGVNWGVLLAPRGIQVSQMALKFFEKGAAHQSIGEIRFNAIEVSGPGTISAKLNYYASPFDYHLTGTGLIQALRAAESPTRPGRAPVVVFESPAQLPLPSAEYNINYELEVLFTPRQHSLGAHVLLDKDQPYTFA